MQINKRYVSQGQATIQRFCRRLCEPECKVHRRHRAKTKRSGPTPLSPQRAEVLSALDPALLRKRGPRRALHGPLCSTPAHCRKFCCLAVLAKSGFSCRLRFGCGVTSVMRISGKVLIHLSPFFDPRDFCIEQTGSPSCSEPPLRPQGPCILLLVGDARRGLEVLSVAA